MSVAKVMGLALHQNRLQGIKVTELARWCRNGHEALQELGLANERRWGDRKTKIEPVFRQINRIPN